MPKLIVIDGNSLMYRAFYALPAMTSRGGTPTGAIYGFLSMLLKLAAGNPEYMLVAFDMHGPTIRHESYAEYKSNRKPMPDELREQMPIIKRILTDMGIAVCECPGYEADDLLGTFARIANSGGIDALLVTGDRDALQLISDSTHVLMTKKGISETIEFDAETLYEQYGVTPAQIVDLKGLMGDASDNIPGIPGVGEKTAVKLIKKYGGLEESLKHADDEKGALRQKLTDNADIASISYQLAVIHTDAPIDMKITDCAFDASQLQNAVPLMTELELKSLIARIPKVDMPAESTSYEKVAEEIAVKDMDELELALTSISKSGVLAIVVADNFVSISDSAERQHLISTNASLIERGLDACDVFRALKPVLENPTVPKLTFDAKKIMHTLSRYEIKLNGLKFDAMIADYLIHATRPASSLHDLYKGRFGTEEGTSAGAAGLFILFEGMTHDMEKLQLMELYETVELPLISVLFDMEETGFSIDTDILAALSDSMSIRIRELSNEIYELAGEQFSILSTKQLGSILFEKLGLPPYRKTKTGYSTDSETLEALHDMHPIIPLITEYRFLTKLKSTFLDGLKALVDEHGRVHTSFNQNVTATGRISSTEPNLQNIPVRTQIGREIRKAFVASRGNMLVGADYSQIELRLLAHMSGDERMIEAFINEDDIHSTTASEVFGVPVDEVTPEQRSAAKAVNFGIVYGISDYGLARNLGITRRIASEYISMYMKRYEGVSRYMKECVENGKKNRYAVTIMGRRRELPEIGSSNFNTRSFGERVAMNMPIQGSAADLIKLAMVRVHRRLTADGLKAKLVLQIHDELIIDCPEDEVGQVKLILEDCMQNVVKLRVPLTADVHTGLSWYDTK